MSLKVLPYPEASTVVYKGDILLVDKVSMHMGPCYALIGIAEDKSVSYLQWIPHHELKLILGPTLRSWDRLTDARNWSVVLNNRKAP